jgi:chemotaxis protein MotB
MKRSSGPWRPHPSALLLALLAAGCVSSGSYREAVDERDAARAENRRLEERIGRLEASTQSLDQERVELIDQLEDLHRQQAELEVDLGRLRKAEAELSESLALREQQLARRNEELESLRGTYEGLVSDLEAEVAAGQIQIQQLREGLRLNLTQEVLFPSGSAEVNASGRSVLARVSERLRELPNHVEVRGHTDNVPIASQRYPTNWELAGARAARVVRLLAENGLAPERLSAVSVGEYAPVASNDTEVGRARNRRIEITLEPVRHAAAASPSQEADAGP